MFSTVFFFMGYPFAWLFCNLLRRFGACFAETAVERTTAIGRAGFAIVACLGVVSPSLSGIPAWLSTHHPSPSLWSSSGTACFNGPNCWVCEAPCYKHFCAYWGMWMKLVCVCSSPINRACYNAGCLPDYSQVWASGASLECCSHGACFAEPYHHFHCGVFVWEFEGYEILSHHVDFRKGGLKKKKKKPTPQKQLLCTVQYCFPGHAPQTDIPMFCSVGTRAVSHL